MPDESGGAWWRASSTWKWRDDELVVQAGLIGVSDLKQPDPVGQDRPDLLFKPYTPRFPERVRDFARRLLRGDPGEGTSWSTNPFESFDVVVQFLRQAAQDPAVVAVKQTLYRTSAATARSSRR